MDLADNLCMNCFERLTQGSICTECGFDNDSPTNMLHMPRKTVLGSKYIVGNAVEEESDSIIYVGYDVERDVTVSIREFMPRGISSRLEGNCDVHVRERFKNSFQEYKANFIKLWNTVKELNSLSAIIPVIEIFEENETAYAICENPDYVTLHDFLLNTEGGAILWSKARIMFMPVLTTIEALHERGIIHGGLNPDNLVLCRDGKVKIANFCISECISATGALEFNVHSGYTALEQYDNKHEICPATDIYSFSACIYRALVGNNPPDAVSREMNDKLMIPNRIAERIPAHVIRALGGGLQIYPEKRIQNVNDYRELLNAAPSVVAKASSTGQKLSEEDEKKSAEELHEEREKQRAAKRDKKKQTAKIIAIILAVLIVAGICVYIFGFSGLFTEEETTEETTLATYTVPDFCVAGYTKSDIENSGSWNSQFTITFEYAYSTEVEEGIIFEQSVEAGTEVEQGTAITLTVSKGIETATVPDVGGLTEEEAVEQLEELGFDVDVVYVYNTGAYTAGTVRTNYGITPEAGSVVAKGEDVIIQVYDEVETTTEATTEEETEDDDE